MLYIFFFITTITRLTQLSQYISMGQTDSLARRTVADRLSVPVASVLSQPNCENRAPEQQAPDKSSGLELEQRSQNWFHYGTSN